MASQSEKAKKAAELVSDAYGVSTGAMYELLQAGAKGDVGAVRALKGMGMVVGSAMDVVKFIDAASRDDVREQITSGCSIGGGIAGGLIGSGALSIVVGALGSKAGEYLCGELYDEYQEWKKHPTGMDDMRRMYVPPEPNDLSFSSMNSVTPSPELIAAEALKERVTDKVTLAVNGLCDERNFTDETIRGNLCSGMTVVALKADFTGLNTIHAALNHNDIHLMEESQPINRYAKADSGVVGRTAQVEHLAEIAAFEPSAQTLGIGSPMQQQSQSSARLI